MLQSGFVSFFEQKLQGLPRTITVHGNPYSHVPHNTDNKVNLNKMQGLSLDPKGQSKLSVINNEASVFGCPYSAV